MVHLDDSENAEVTRTDTALMYIILTTTMDIPKAMAKERNPRKNLTMWL